MMTRNLVAAGGLVFALAACKMPTLNPAEKPGPPPQPSLSAKPAPPPPAATSTAMAAPPCACPGDAASAAAPTAAAPPQAVDRPVRTAAARTRHQQGAAPSRRAVRTERRARSGASHYETTGRQSHGYGGEASAGHGYVAAAPVGDTGRGRAVSMQAYETHSFESEQQSSSYQSSYEGGYQSGYEGGHGSGYQGGYVEGYGHSPYAQGGGYSATRDYIVRRSVRGDVQRSRAWTRVGR